MMNPMDRRKFLGGMMAGVGGYALGANGLSSLYANDGPRPDYTGPNVVIIRFGGGVRRPETIQSEYTYSPYLLHELSKRGVLFPMMEISSEEGIETSHGQGTLNILTGIYDKYKDVDNKFLGERFEARVPTVFEYLRKAFNVPEYQTLIVNGEDRIDEEFYSFSNNHLFGARYKCNVLSLYRFKTYLLRKQIERGPKDTLPATQKAFHEKEQKLKEMEDLDYRVKDKGAQSEQLNEFWEQWRRYYGESGLVNPRGDRVLTELAIRGIKQLRPRLMMVNYNDCDYVHWGNMTHYTRGIQIMDEGLRQIVDAVEADEEYRDNTIFAIVPDCGRDNNRGMSIPCQHHFNTKSSRMIFGLFFGPGIPQGDVVDKQVEQINVAPTIVQHMGGKAEFADAGPLEEAFA